MIFDDLAFTPRWFDAELGARPMKRAIMRLIEAPLAEMVLRGQLDSGSVAMVTVENGEIVVDAVMASSRERGFGQPSTCA